MGIMIRGVVLFCLVDNLLGFACSNDYFSGKLFFVPCLFATNPRKLQNTNVGKEKVPILAIANVNL
jgi:hypothetical protein